MRVQDFEGTSDINDETVLRDRLSSVRRGQFGAFILSHKGLYPCLWIHFNEGLAYLHYFPAVGHPGFQPKAASVGSERTDGVHFLQVDGFGGDAFDMPSELLVHTDVALNAACEFFRSPSLPPSIDWFEL